MNRVDFMNQLESLLQNIPSTEREEAIQYYNDYFDDAGKENEQEVIEALGNPARVAENIKRDLPGSGLGEAVQKVKASDRVLMEYGKNMQGNAGGQEDPGQNQKKEEGSGKAPGGDFSASGKNSSGYQNTAGSGSTFGSAGEGWNPFEDRGMQDHYGQGKYEPEKKPKEDGMPVWAMAILITVLIFAFPVVAGLVLTILGTVFGLLLAWFGLILGFGIATAGCLIVMIVMTVVGFTCLVSSPWAGMAVIGAGLICGCVGILFLMLTVLMAGGVTPVICRGVASVFRMLFGRKRRTKAA